MNNDIFKDVPMGSVTPLQGQYMPKRIIHCSRPECQTTAGCICNEKTSRATVIDPPERDPVFAELERLQKENSELKAENARLDELNEQANSRLTELTPKAKATHVGAPAIFELELLCDIVRGSFGGDIYLVGSSMHRPDWRDIDLRLMLDDEEFDKLFPGITDGHQEHNRRWLLMTVAISEYLSKRSGLPVDFQFQKATLANKHHDGIRNPMGRMYTK